jgi:hypothetical protein
MEIQLPMTEIKEEPTMEANVTSVYQTAHSQTPINISRPVSDINSKSNSQLMIRERSNSANRCQTPAAAEEEVSSKQIEDKEMVI